MQVMTRTALLFSCFLIAAGAHAQTGNRLGELRVLLQQRPAVTKAPAPSPVSNPAAAAPASQHATGTVEVAPRQLSAEERAELRRQLTEFRRPPAGKGS
jgi:hypothetical protein